MALFQTGFFSSSSHKPKTEKVISLCKPSRHIYPTSHNYNFVIKTAVKSGDHAEVAVVVVVKLNLCWHTITAELPGATERMFSCYKLKYS